MLRSFFNNNFWERKLEIDIYVKYNIKLLGEFILSKHTTETSRRNIDQTKYRITRNFEET